MGEGVHIYGSNGGVSSKSDINRGLNRSERIAVSLVESKIRNLNVERAFVIGPNGQILAQSIKGTGDSASFGGNPLPSNSILTHNHPKLTNFGDNIATRIGLSFSGDDIKLAVKYNMKEVRVVTSNYTYSLRRPKGGWGVSGKEAMNRWNNSINKNMKTASDYAQKSPKGMESQRYARANVSLTHNAVKAFAKSIGAEYTRRKK